MKSIGNFTLLLLALGAASVARAAPTYNILRPGLNDLEHTRNDGYTLSTFQSSLFPSNYLNQAGQAVGLSNRYNGGSTALGRSAWLYNGTTTLKIGLVGPEHTSSSGTKGSLVRRLNEAGQVVGTSTRFIPLIPNNRSAWLYNGTTTIDIGLVGAEHTSPNGLKNSFFLTLIYSLENSSGRVEKVGRVST